MHGDLEDYSFFFKSLEITYCWNKQFLKIVWSLPYCGRVMNSITLPLPGWWIRTQASFTSCCMRIGHPNSVLFWGPTKTERWKTYTKKWLQRYTNGLHLEADAAPLTTLEKRYVLENSSQSMRTNHKLRQLLYPSKNTRHPIFLCTSMQKTKAQM